MLVDQLIGLGLGLLLAVVAVLLWAQHLNLIKSLLVQGVQAEEQQAIDLRLRSELRRAGRRHVQGASPEHDALALEMQSSTPALHYRCDGCHGDAQPDRVTLRLQARTLSLRSAGSGGHQALHDPQWVGIDHWAVETGHTAECSAWVRVRRHTSGVWAHGPDLWIRPRNLGLRPCEQPLGPP